MSEFDDFMTSQFERDVLKKIIFLKEFGFGEPTLINNLQAEIPDLDLTYEKGETRVSASISVYTTNFVISRGKKYFPFRHYLTFIKSDELTKLP